jgi:hypothetical protein
MNNGSVTAPLKYAEGQDKTPMQMRNRSICETLMKIGTGTNENMRRQLSAAAFVDTTNLLTGSPGEVIDSEEGFILLDVPVEVDRHG